MIPKNTVGKAVLIGGLIALAAAIPLAWAWYTTPSSETSTPAPVTKRPAAAATTIEAAPGAEAEEATPKRKVPKTRLDVIGTKVPLDNLRGENLDLKDGKDREAREAAEAAAE